MIITVTGTPGSGKSRKAENLVLELSKPEDRYYIATMLPYGESGAKRVEKHRKYRAGKGFVTIEQPVNLPAALSAMEKAAAEKNVRLQEATVLLECVTNLVANEMFAKKCPDPAMLISKIPDDIRRLSKNVKHLILVTNSFSEEEGSDEETRQYIHVMNAINKTLEQMAEETYFTDDTATTTDVL